MRNKQTQLLGVLALLALSTLNSPLSTLHAQGTAFTYQGRLNSGGAPASGSYDLAFTLYNTNITGIAVAGPFTNSATSVSNGMFTTTVNFGPGVFTGTSNWLEIAVSTNGANSFTTLAPRQQLTPTPYAIFAEGVSASGLTGTVPAAAIGGTYGNTVNFNNGADSFDGTFSGQFFGSSFIGGSFVGSFIGSGASLVDVWHTTGNFGTTPLLNFLGTMDNQPLVIKVNNQQAHRYEPAYDTPNVIGGNAINSVQPGLSGVTIGGGGSTVFGSQPNLVTNNGQYATIAGGYHNTVTNYGGAILGGSVNFAGGNFATLGGGQYNSGFGDYSFIGGGYLGTIQPNSAYSTIAGGYNNLIQSNSVVATISGGHDNTIQSASFAIIGGGGYNVIQPGAYDSVVGGGGYNIIQTNAHSSFIGSGGGNTIQNDSSYAAIGGGLQNLILTNDSYSAIGGGLLNNIQGNADQSVIAGGNANSIQFGARESFIGGGYANVIRTNAYISTIGGGAGNNIGVGSYASSIGGGDNNLINANADHAVIGGGGYNIIGTNGNGAAIDSGYANTIGTSADRATIAGGNGNVIQNNSTASTIGGGIANTIGANSALSTIAGGNYNYVANNSWQAFIGGGLANTNGGYGATVPGGVYNVASGIYSFAAGYRAKATNDGAFVWADSQNADFGSTTTNQFSVRANGGVRFVTGGAGLTLDGQPLVVSGSSSYIQNQTASPQAASFNLNGSMTAASFVVASGTASGTVAVNGLIVTNSLRAPGAGLETGTPAFVHRATGANIDPSGLHRTTITHPLCDGDPNAILLITHNYNPGNTGNILDTHPTSVYYNPILLKWQIYHDDFVALTTNSAWNVLVIKP